MKKLNIFGQLNKLSYKCIIGGDVDWGWAKIEPD